MSVTHTIAKTFGIAQTAPDGDGLDGWFFRRWFSFTGLLAPLALLYVEFLTGKDTELNRDIVAACQAIAIWISAIYLLGSSAQYILSARFGGALGNRAPDPSQRQAPYFENQYTAPIGQPQRQIWQPGEDSRDASIDDPDAPRRRR